MSKKWTVVNEFSKTYTGLEPLTFNLKSISKHNIVRKHEHVVFRRISVFFQAQNERRNTKHPATFLLKSLRINHSSYQESFKTFEYYLLWGQSAWST